MLSTSAWSHPLSHAWQHIADYFKLSKKDATQYVEKSYRARKEYVRRYFGVDVADPHQYHLIINSGKLSYKEAAKIIVGAASRQCAKR